MVVEEAVGNSVSSIVFGRAIDNGLAGAIAITGSVKND